MRRFLVWFIGVFLIALASIPLPPEGMWRAAKSFSVVAAAIVLAVVALARGEWTAARVRAALLAVPNFAVLLFVSWVGISTFASDLPDISREEAIRHLGGALVYVGAVYGLAGHRSLERLVNLILVAGVAAAGVALAMVAHQSAERYAGAFHNEQLLAAFLCVVGPVVVTRSLAEDDPWRRSLVQGAALVVAAAIAMSRNRSAWLGAALGLIVVAALVYRWRLRGHRHGLQRHQLIVPLLTVASLLLPFVLVGEVRSLVSERARTLGTASSDPSLRWRLAMWHKALRMTRERPIFGWGVGTYPIYQSYFFHPDAYVDTPYLSPRLIMSNGPTMSENAHNTYLQLMAELGIPGLVFYLGVLAAFWVTAWRALGRLRRGFRQCILIGCMGGVAAQMVAAIGSPAWEFPECSIPFWLILGIGMAIAGVGNRGLAEGEADEPSRRRRRRRREPANVEI